jgi:hypothetical protein
MKKVLLFIMAGAMFSLNLMSQENVLLNGNMDEKGAWEIYCSDGDAADMTWEFGNTLATPAKGEGACLRVSYSKKSGPMNQILAQKVKLVVGGIYEFSGAFKDVGTDSDLDQQWHQVIIWPTKEDVDLTDGLYAGPASDDEQGSIMLTHTVWTDGDVNDHGWTGIGKNTTFKDDLNPDWIYGDGIGIGGMSNNDDYDQGDTTIYKVPEVLIRFQDELNLGKAGDTIEYWFIYQIGQWIDSGQDIENTWDFSFDEFKLIKIGTFLDPVAVEQMSSSSEISIYPNPINDVLNVNYSGKMNTISLRNMLGQEILRMNDVGSGHTIINTSELTSGIYILSVLDESGKTHSSKILKK